LGKQNATLVLGQADFIDSACNGGAQPPGAATLCAPAGLMLDRFGNLWVADSNNDRVVKYEAPLGSGAAAAMVIGQGDDGNFTTAGCDRGIAPGDLFGLGADSLCAPAAVAVDANVDLYVADTGNNRSTIYDGIVATPTATPTASATATATASATATATASATSTLSPTATVSFSATPTVSATPSATPTATPVLRGGKMKLSAKTIKFGKVAVGSRSGARTLQIENAGTTTLAATVPTTSAPFPVSGGEFTVDPHGSMAVMITFAPTKKGSAHAVLEITSSDPKHRVVKVKVSGTGK
jgi:hypothetical protein